MQCLIVVLLMGGFLSNISTSILMLFFPAELEGRSISPAQSSLVLALSSIPYALTPLALSSGILSKVGRGNTFSCGALLLGFSFITFGYLHFVPNPEAFIWIVLMTLIVQGMGAASIQTASYAILSGTLDKSVSRATTALVAAQSLGGAIAPLIGGKLFKSEGYLGPFLVMGVLLVFMSLGKFFLGP